MIYLGNLQDLDERDFTQEDWDEHSRKFGEYMERQLAGMRRWEEKSKKDDGREYASYNSIG